MSERASDDGRRPTPTDPDARLRVSIWNIILYLFILPFRPFVMAKQYKKIWTPEGSPLVVTCLRQEARFVVGAVVDFFFFGARVEFRI